MLPLKILLNLALAAALVVSTGLAANNTASADTGVDLNPSLTDITQSSEINSESQAGLPTPGTSTAMGLVPSISIEANLQSAGGQIQAQIETDDRIDVQAQLGVPSSPEGLPGPLDLSLDLQDD